MKTKLHRIVLSYLLSASLAMMVLAKAAIGKYRKAVMSRKHAPIASGRVARERQHGTFRNQFLKTWSHTELVRRRVRPGFELQGIVFFAVTPIARVRGVGMTTAGGVSRMRTQAEIFGVREHLILVLVVADGKTAAFGVGNVHF